MSHSEHKNDTVKPKKINIQFWPFLLILLPSLIIFTGIAIAFMDDHIKQDFYPEKTSKNSEKLDQINKARNLEIQADIDIDVSVWQLTIDSNTDLGDNHLIVELQHKSMSQSNTSLTLFNAGNGQYRGTLSDIEKGIWHIDIYPKGQAHNDKWRLKGEINLADTRTQINSGYY